MKRLIASVIAVALCCATFVLAGCGAKSETKDMPSITIGTLATEDILPMWVAEDEGLFKEAGLDAKVEVFQSATELIAAVNAGDVDYAMTDPMVAASIYASGTDVEMKWVTLGADASQGRFGIMTSDSSIKSLNDLAGVKVGVGSNTILEYVMDRLMEQAGVPDDKIVTEELQKLPVRYEAMASGQVKAAALPASLLALGEANGCTVVADDTKGDNLSQSVMIVRSELLKDDGGAATVDALGKVWDKAAKEINASPEKYRKLLVEKAHLSDPIAETYQIAEYPTVQLPDGALVEDILGWMKAKDYLAAGITYNAKDGTFSGR